MTKCYSLLAPRPTKIAHRVQIMIRIVYCRNKLTPGLPKSNPPNMKILKLHLNFMAQIIAQHYMVRLNCSKFWT